GSSRDLVRRPIAVRMGGRPSTPERVVQLEDAEIATQRLLSRAEADREREVRERHDEERAERERRALIVALEHGAERERPEHAEGEDAVDALEHDHPAQLAAES